MNKIVVVYWSQTGNTSAMAEANRQRYYSNRVVAYEMLRLYY